MAHHPAVVTAPQPDARTVVLRDDAPRVSGKYVLYWMTAARRTQSNFALDRALQWCQALNRPLVVLEPLRVDYLYASDRLHTFVLQGMQDNHRAFARAGVCYLPWIERASGDGHGLIDALARDACLVVTDDYPAFFLPRMLAAASKSLTVRLEAVDGCGLMPMRATQREFTRAHSFRRYLQGELPGHLMTMPRVRPLARYALGMAKVAPAVLRRPGFASAAELDDPRALVGALPVDHAVGPVALAGGSKAAGARLRTFVADELDAYGDRRNHPDDDATSGLSPYLHFGHVSAHEVLRAIADRFDWAPDRLGPPIAGAREGWWGLPGSPEAFLDELVTWRELSLNLCVRRRDYAELSSMPAWAQKTIAEHAGDPREHLYSRAQLEDARTADPLWNAAQTQLRREGRIHNYLRMLWGKQIYQWSPDASTALATMVYLNDRWALDGRDPNSYSGIGWVLGRYDRAWGPERPVFGKLRYMTSDSARRKLRVRRYLDRYGEQASLASA